MALRASIGVMTAAIALLSASACAQIIGLEPYGSGGGASSGSSSGAGGDARGGAGGTASTSSGGGCDCVTAPKGWNGPVALEDGGSCATGKLEVAAMLQLDGTACTSCSCDADDTCELLIYEDSLGSGTCTDNTPSSAAPGCAQLPSADQMSLVGFGVEVMGGAVCTLSNGCAPTPQTFALCATTRSCDGGTCRVGGADACVYNDDPSSVCPQGFTGREQTGFTTYAPSCTCGSGAPTKVECNPQTLETYPSTNCMGGGGVNATPGVCEAVGQSLAVEYVPLSAGDCAMPTLSGKPSGPVHVCCAE